MVVTNEDIMAERVRLLKGQGMDSKKRYWFPVVGYNYRMTNIQAAIGLAQLENISWYLKRRREIAYLYHKYLNELYNFIELPGEKEWARHSFWMFSILIKDNVKISRDEFMQQLEKEGIETRPIFYPMHVLPPYRESDVNFPVATRTASRGLNLPTHALLKEEDVVYITDGIQKILL